MHWGRRGAAPHNLQRVQGDERGLPPFLHPIVQRTCSVSRETSAASVALSPGAAAVPSPW